VSPAAGPPPVPGGLAHRYRLILAYAGVVWAISGGLLLLPLAGLAAWPEEARQALDYVLPAALLLLAGLAAWQGGTRRGHLALGVQEGAVIALLGWAGACLAGAWPFIGVLGLDFTRAFFESVSGFTTTGLSVVDVEAAPRTLLLWRSIMQLAGGAGLAVIMLAAIAGPAGTGIPAAEGRTDRLAPHVRASALMVLTVYAAFAAVGIPAYLLAGMGWFDAVNHTFAAISTGGFSTRAASIGYWDSAAVEFVTLPLMLLGNMNFLTAFLLLKGRFRVVARNSELRFGLGLLAAGVVLLFLFVTQAPYPGLAKQVRVTVFEATTALTTTGFSTVGYNQWTALGWHLMVLLMLVGGGAGSTAGGIKQYRACLLLKAAAWEARRLLAPRTAVPVRPMWMGERQAYVGDADLAGTAAFAALYLAVWTLGTGVLAAYGYPLQECLFEYASALGTVGLSIGISGATAPDGVLWAEIAGMFLGRLEFFVVAVALARLATDLPRLLRPRNRR
jgi:trk system potassium uptake protein TrkH